MKLPAKIEYSLKAILELSLHSHEEGPTQISSISKAQSIPREFLLQILIRLKNAGIVKSTRGVAGGYSLARDPEKIKLSEVINAIDDNILAQLPRRKRNTKSEEIIDSIWSETNKEIIEKFSSITFEDLRMKMMKDREVVYYI